MGSKGLTEDTKKREGEILEREYDQAKDGYPKPGKRLREKERFSKKSNTVLKRGRVLEAYSQNSFRVKVGKEELLCPLSGRLKIIDFAKRNVVVVGDYVKVDSAQNYRIEEIEERKNSLQRYIDKGKQQLEVLIASNIDQVIITTSCAEPAFNLNLVDRYLCAAELAEIKPLLCVNKIDLAEDSGMIKEQCLFYEQLGIVVIYTSAQTGAGIDELKQRLHRKDSVFSGVSGTGKTSLINRLDPTLQLKTGQISTTSLKGTHTTSSSRLIPWSFGGYLIDTPGIKTFGLDKSDRSEIPRKFPGFAKWAKGCRFTNCSHTHEDGCLVLEALEKKKLPEARYQSYLNLLTSLE